MMQETTGPYHRWIAQHASRQEAIRVLKRRRDDLLNRSCSRPESAAIMAEVREINREIAILEEGRSLA